MNDYGRDANGRYTGNPQQFDENQLKGESQEAIAAHFGPWDELDDGSLLDDLACRVVLETGITLTMLAARQSLFERSHPLLEGDPLAGLTIQAIRFAATHGDGEHLDRRVQRRMAALRYPPRKVPVDPVPEWIADADARKGAGDAA